jgi:hypothetical protein
LKHWSVRWRACPGWDIEVPAGRRWRCCASRIACSIRSFTAATSAWNSIAEVRRTPERSADSRIRLSDVTTRTDSFLPIWFASHSM